MIQIATFTVGALLIFKGRMQVTASREILSTNARIVGFLMLLLGAAMFFVDNIMIGVGGFVALTLLAVVCSSKIEPQPDAVQATPQA